MRGKLERKVKAVALTGPITAAIAWALVTYVPAFEAGLPDALQNAISGIVGVVLAVVAGYWAKHTDRPDAP